MEDGQISYRERLRRRRAAARASVIAASQRSTVSEANAVLLNPQQIQDVLSWHQDDPGEDGLTGDRGYGGPEGLPAETAGEVGPVGEVGEFGPPEDAATFGSVPTPAPEEAGEPAKPRTPQEIREAAQEMLPELLTVSEEEYNVAMEKLRESDPALFAAVSDALKDAQASGGNSTI